MSSKRILNESDFLDALGAETARIGAEIHVPLASPPGLKADLASREAVPTAGGSLRSQPLLVNLRRISRSGQARVSLLPGGSAYDALGDAGAVVLSIADPALWLVA